MPVASAVTRRRVRASYRSSAPTAVFPVPFLKADASWLKSRPRDGPPSDVAAAVAVPVTAYSKKASAACAYEGPCDRPSTVLAGKGIHVLVSCPSNGEAHRGPVECPYVPWGASRGRRIGESLLQPLVWPVYATYSPEESEYVGFVEDEQVVQARSADAARHARTNGMHFRGS